MDYVLFGMGYGATLMLLGWALRTFGPERKYKNVDPADIDLSVVQRHWIRFVQGLGGVIAIAGTAMVLFTFVIMLVNPDDDTGSFIALVIWGFLTVALLVWCWFYVSTYGLLGIWSRESGYGILGSSSSRDSLRSRDAVSTSRVIPKPRIRDDQHEPVEEAGPDTVAEDAAEDVAPAEPMVETAGVVEAEGDRDEIEPQTSEPVEAAEDAAIDDTDPREGENQSEAEPEYDFGDSTDTTVPSDFGGRAEAIRRLKARQARSGKPAE